MATFTVTKRKNKTSSSWQYDVKHPSLKSGKNVNLDSKQKLRLQTQHNNLLEI